MRSIVIIHPRWEHDHGANGAEHSFRTYENVVRAVTTVAPLVEVLSPGCLVFAARGPSRYFGGEDAVVQKVAGLVADACPGPFGIGVADSRFAAMAAAHVAADQGRVCLVGSDVTQQFIDALPVRALHRLAGVDENVVGLFVRLGLHTCGAVAALGEKALIERFGVDGRTVHRLVTGGEIHLLDPGAPPPDIVRAVDFDSPLTDVRHVVTAARNCIESALTAVADTGRQCLRILLACETDHAETNERIWVEPHGFSTPAVAQRLMWQMDGWLTAPEGHDAADIVSSGVVRVTVTPLECRAVVVDQPLLWGGHQENAERAARAVGLVMSSGATVSVTVPQWSGGRDASGEYERVPVDMVDLCDSSAARARVHAGKGVPREWRGALPVPSPSIVHPTPPVISVVDGHGEDIRVTGRHELSAAPARLVIGERRFAVLNHAGPWPVEERWWDPLRRRRLARVQVLVQEEHSHTERVLLLGLENGQWSLLARYD